MAIGGSMEMAVVGSLLVVALIVIGNDCLGENGLGLLARWRVMQSTSLDGRRIALSAKSISTVLVAGIPVGLGAAAASYSGPVALAAFTAVSYLLVPCNLIMSAIGQAAMPRLSKAHAEGQHKVLWSIVVSLLATALVLGVGAVLLVSALPGRILTVLYGTRLASGTISVFLMPVLWIGTVSLVVGALSYALLGIRQLRIQPISSLCGVVTIGLLSILQGPSAGINGVLGAWLGGLIVTLVISAIALWKCLSISPNQRMEGTRCVGRQA
jgi:O-antigen/teichoic acid export membrane protein